MRLDYFIHEQWKIAFDREKKMGEKKQTEKTRTH